MKSLRIAFFSHDAELYGASRSLVTLVNGLQEKGFQCLILLPYKGPLLDYVKEHRLSHVVVFYPSWFYKPQDTTTKFRRISKFVFRLFNILFDNELNTKLRSFDLLVTNTSAIPIGAFLAAKLNKPHVWYIRELIELHYGFKYVLGKWFFKFIVSKTKLKVFNSAFVRDYYNQLLPGKSYDAVIHNGIFTRDQFVSCYDAYKNRQNSAVSDFVFSIIGYVHEAKGQKQAVDAMELVLQKYRNVKLLVVGSGETDALQRHIDKKGIGAHVTLTGYLQDVTEIFLQSHCVLNCARFEAFGRTTVEAMAYSLPVIGNNSAGTAEIVKHKTTGLLYNSTTVELADCMKQLIANPEWARTLGKQGWKEAYENYNVEKYVDDFLNFVQEKVLPE